MNITLQSVTSSQIQAVGYDATSKTLRVQFKSKGAPSEYDYAGVPPETAAAMLKAESVGKFLGAFIKPKYTAKKVA